MSDASCAPSAPNAANALGEADALRLSAFLPFQLSVLTNTISRRIAERYDAEFGLSIWQWRVMAVLGETPGLTASAITERTAMDKVAVSRAVAGLRQRGLLERQAAAADARRQLLQLSAEGRRIYAQIVPMALSYERELADAVSAEDLTRLKLLLERFAKVVSPNRPLW
jgi:DNA-binding MarR family transcriptional regulator